MICYWGLLVLHKLFKEKEAREKLEFYKKMLFCTN